MSRRGLLASLGVSAAGLAVLGGILLRGADEPGRLPPLSLEGSSAEVVDALKEARARVVAQPQSAEAWGTFGMLLRAHDFKREAEICLVEAERLDPDDFRWPYLRGVSLATSDAEAARESFRRAAELRPELPFVRLRLAELLINLRRLDEAEPHVRAVLDTQPEEARAELNMGRIALLRGDAARALEWAERSSRHAPGQRATHELLSGIHHRLGNRDQSVEQLRILRALPEEATNWEDPLVASVLELRRDPEWLAARAQQLLAAGRTAEGLRLLEEVTSGRSSTPEHAVELARAYELLGDHKNSARVLDRAMAQHSGSAEVRRLRGVVYLSQGQPTRGADLLREAIALKPDFAKAWENLGFAHLMLRDEAAAQEAFETALELDPQLATARRKADELKQTGTE